MAYENPFASLGNVPSLRNSPSGGYQNPFANLPSAGGMPSGMSRPSYLGNLPPIPVPQSTSSAPGQVAQSAHPGFLSSLLNAAGDAWNQTIGKEYSQAKGGLEGLLTGLLSGVNVHTGQAQAPKNVLDPITGYINPQQEAQKYQATKDAMGKGVLPWALSTAADTVTDPLTYAPVGPALKVLGKATGAAKAIDALKQSAPDAIRAPLNAVTSMFQPVNGARPEFLNAISRYTGKVQSGNNKIMNTVRDLLHGTTPESRATLTNGYESTVGPMINPESEQLRTNIGDLLQEAFTTAKDKGLITSEINPDEMQVARYLPHVNVSKLDESAGPFSDISRRNPNVDAGKARGVAGTIQSINDASDKPVFENDLAKILTYHLAQINKAGAIRDLIDEATQHGLPTDGEVKAGQQFPGTFQTATEYTSPHTGESVLLPESEAAYLKNLKPSGLESETLRAKAYKGTVNALNKTMFLSSPLVHLLNNLTTQTLVHDPGIFLKMPKYVSSMWKGIEPGGAMDNALKSGAMHLSSVIHGAATPKKMAQQIVKDIAPKAPLPVRLPKIIANGYTNLTPKGEQVFRAAAFERALDKGMTPDEAANWIRSIYGGRIAGDAVSPVEKWMTGIMPFFNWTKTAVGSTLKNAANNPKPYVAGFNSLNDYNQQVTGHGMGQNPNPLSVALPWKDVQGNQEYLTPYAPPFDVAKLGKEVADSGLRGIPNFIFNRTNPVVKYGSQALTGEQNPITNPNNKFFVSPYPSLPSSMNTRGVFFGDKGPQVPAYLGQMLQDISNPLSIGSDLQSKGLGDTLLTQLLGGSISAPSPTSQQKQQSYLQKQQLSQFKSYLKKQSQGK